MRKILLIFTFVLINNLIAQNAGNTGLSFLKFGFGARNTAMADLGNSISNDLSALHYNPARLSMNSDNEIMVNHNSWIQDVSSQMVGVKTNLFGIPFAVGFNVTNVNDIEIRTRPGEPQSKFNANYFYGSISSAYKFSDDLSVGATIKYLYEGILNDEATGLGFDFGLNYLTPIENLNVSAVLRNLGSMNALRNQETKLPTEIRIGSNYNFYLTEYKFDFVVAGEYQKYIEADNHINLGMEIIYDNLFAVRTGYQTNYETRDLSFGFGLMWGNLKFDYAYVPFKLSLGSGKIFSLAFKF